MLGEKFAGLVAPVLGDEGAKALLAVLWSIDDMSNVADVRPHVSGDRPAEAAE